MTTPDSLQRILLTGFMGSGKTTVGLRLAQQLGWEFLDLDHVIEQQEHRPIAQIFAESGEPHFRALELNALREHLAREHVVLALGGGAPTNPALRELLQSTAQTLVVHLEAPFAVLYDRCRTQAADPQAAVRPLLGDRVSAEARYMQRQAMYAAVAHLTVQVGESPPDRVAESIAASLFPAPTA